ncbi:MAG TPA: hypothetical protein PKY82_07900 [Pyrinomonadaceae bacterium]|nr:hypothetical protein [Pyrinomonadaceae bacterium]
MKKFLLGFSIVSLLTGVIIGQSVNSSGSAAAINKTAISKNRAGLESGTQISGQLQNSIDVKKAKVGDQVVLKTTQAIKQNGKTVVNKGSNIVGRVTEVQQKTKGQAMSKIGVVFDSLQNGKMMMPISATIVSLTQAQSSASLNDNSADIMGSSSTNTTTRTTGSNSGGLLGGVTNTVGSVVNTTTNTVGGVTNTVGQTVGNTTNTLGGTLKGIQISQSSDVSAQGSSTLSLQGGNLHLEKGTTFNLRLTEASSVNTGNR